MLKVIHDQIDLVLVQIILLSTNSSASSAGLKNFAIKKSVHACHDQGHLKYREPAGMQLQ